MNIHPLSTSELYRYKTHCSTTEVDQSNKGGEIR